MFAVCFAGCANAQFADQATFAGAGGGTANAQTLTLANVTSYADLVGVIVKYVPSVSNTGSATINVNSLGAKTVLKPTSAGLATLAGNGCELIAAQPVFVMEDSNGNFDLLSVTCANVNVGAANLANSALSFGMPVNLQLNAFVISNQLSINIVGNNGSTASTINPILIPFRDTTLANGDPVIVSVQSALSFTIGSGQTMGCASGAMCRLWVVAINNAGSVALCAFNANQLATHGPIIAPINEGLLQTSQSGTSGGTGAHAYYCNVSAVTNAAIRILGYIEINEATAGTWASGPTFVQLFGPGIKKPGDEVQQLSAIGVGTPISVFAPSSAADPVEVSLSYACQAAASATPVTLNIERGATVLVSQLLGGVSTSVVDLVGSADFIDTPQTTSSQTYTAVTTGSACSINEVTIVLKEIMG
jgi:hypothetical protein